VRRAFAWLAALWWGGVTALAFVVPPVLFTQLAQRAEAAAVAATFFAIQGGASLVLACACVWVAPPAAGRRRWQWACAGAAVAAAFNLWVAGPALSLHASAGLATWPLRPDQWHGVASILVLLQWGVATWSVARALRLPTHTD
jgi:hypothetical protein